MTAEGYRALDDDLKRLKSIERPSVIAAISEARSHGDLSENAEYHAAKERQGWIEGRIAEIEEQRLRVEQQIESVTTLARGVARVLERREAPSDEAALPA